MELRELIGRCVIDRPLPVRAIGAARKHKTTCIRAQQRDAAGSRAGRYCEAMPLDRRANRMADPSCPECGRRHTVRTTARDEREISFLCTWCSRAWRVTKPTISTSSENSGEEVEDIEPAP
jgi:hypothetical protein